MSPVMDTEIDLHDLFSIQKILRHGYVFVIAIRSECKKAAVQGASYRKDTPQTGPVKS